MNTIIKVTVMLSVLLLGAGYSQFNSQDSLMARQFLKQKGISENQLKNSSKLNQSFDSQKSAEKKQDSLSNVPGKDTTFQESMYESILKNRRIDPDSLLRSLTVFGLDVFSGIKPSTFAPSDYAATPADYVVGSGDEIVVLLWGRINEGEYRLKVDREGKINIPHIGPVAVAGLPFGALQKNILDRVQTIEGVQATVSMGELRSIGVYIVGEVKLPGYYTVSGMSNVTNALFAAGGPTRRGSLRSVQLKRNGSAIATIDFYDFLLSGKDNTNLKLQSGDVILVPIVKKMVAIAGNVRRSALYEIKQNTSLKDALSLAGGVSPAAWTNRIQLERFKDNQMQVVLDLTSESPQSIPDYEVTDGDIIKIFPVVEKNRNAVYLSGNVMRPGKYEYKPGMKLSDILPDYTSLMAETYYEYALVLRQDPPSFLNRLVPFSLKSAMDDRSSAANIALQPRDEVIVYSRDYFEPDRTVTVDGAITNPGNEKLLDNMKIRDLIIKAGGILEQASPERGELYRRSFIGENVVTQKIDFCVSCALADDPQHNIPLKKFDRVYIRTKKGWQQERKVTLKGEFIFPGDYIVLEKETLEHLIKRAGGFTPEAFLLAARLTRVSVKQLEQRGTDQYISRLESDAVKLTTELASQGQEVTEAQKLLAQQEMLFTKMKNTETLGRIVIDLSNAASYKDFYLEDGDTLYVPKPSGTVSVIGEVFNPSTFRFLSQGKKVGDYIEMAGGLKENADKPHVYLYKASGTILTNKNVNILNSDLSPGDVIVVPQKIVFSNNFKVFMDTLEAIFKLSSILSIIATLVMLSNR
jgi:polysaccharide export outer membrane protein